MSKILDMRAERAKKWEAAKAFLDSHADKNGMLSAEDAQTYDRMEQEIVDLGRAVERMERAEAIENEMNKPVGNPILNKPGEDVEDKKGRAAKAYNNAFWQMIKARRGRMDARVVDALETGVDSEGGYLVPEEFERRLIDALTEQNVFRQLATVITTAGERKIPVVASHGSAAWIDEEAEYPESDVSFGQVSLGAHKLATLMKVSEELMNDSAFDMPSFIAAEFARRIGEAEEEAFFTGDGAGKPTGIITMAQAGITAAAADKVTFDEIIDLYYSLRAPYRNKAVFVINDTTAKLLRKLKGQDGQYIWQPAITANAPDVLLGRPVYTSQYMPAATTGNKAIIFGDMSYYWVADRTTRTFKRLDELYATTGQVGFIANERVDGKLILPEAVKTLTMA